MPHDYTTAPPPREFELIPNGTIASVLMKLRPGGAGEDGLLKRSKNGACEMLDVEFVVIDGPYERRKFWGNMVVSGTTAGHQQAAEIARSMRRSIVESARGVQPNDLSPEARAKRTVDLADFDGMAFIAKVGIETGALKNDGSGERYSDKNILVAAITPDKHEWHQVFQSSASPAPTSNGGGDAAAAPAGNTGSAPAAVPAAIATPSWAERSS